MRLRGRRRPRPGRPTSDVTRFRGVWIAALAGALAAGACALFAAPPGELRGAPGPLARPHARAALTCEACHQSERPAAACEGCHGAHPSTRAPHRRLAAAGELDCADCHRVHRSMGGVALSNGRAVRFGPGVERELDIAPRSAGASPELTVPLVPLSACARCHDAGDRRDPIAACLLAGQEPLGDLRPTVCFDEHRPPGASSREAAWEAAREIAARAPAAPAAAAPPIGPGGWLGLGALVALLTWGGVRGRHVMAARRAGAAAESAPAAPVRPPEERRLPVIDASACIGCHACVDACPFDVLEMRSFVATVARPADCCGLTLCEQTCPTEALVMGEGEPNPDVVAVGDDLGSREVDGLYLAGDVTGLPLIKNAINQGALAARAIAADLEDAEPDRSGGERDLVIIGAGPAGISAALEAKARGLSYVALEQDTVAGSIKSFPRGKLVFDQPLELPLHGALWLREATKEELVGRWLQIVRRERLAIEEGARVKSVERRGDGFAVWVAREGDEPRELRARRVLLAVGRRGTPRRLPVPVPEAFEDRVHYSLADARSFAGQRVLVVGLGDVAMEAAIALSRQPGTRVTVCSRGSDFRRGKARNIRELRRRLDTGAVTVLWDTEVARLDAGRALLRSPGRERELPCDAVFVLIGSIPPREFLARAGVQLGAPPTSKESES